MGHTQYLNDVLIFLLVAVVVVAVFKRLNISPIIGYLISGVMIGPYALGLIAEVEATRGLGEFGVVFLLFSIGLKLSLQRLQVLRRYVFGLGFLQVFVTGALIAGIASLFDQSIEASILIGSALALSSTAVGLQVLTEKKELAARFGRVSFAILLFQDLFVVLLLVLLTTLGAEQTSVVDELGYAALKAGMVLAIIIASGRMILRPVYRLISSLNNEELFVATTLLVVLMTSVATEAAGLSMELGAFLAGLVLSETEYRHQVQADIQPFHGLLLGLFFITVGMSIDLGLLKTHMIMIPSLIVALILGKIGLITLVCRLFRLPFVTSLRSGLLLASGGEFVFVLFAPAIENGLISVEVGQIIFVIVAISMGMTPFLDSLGKLLDEYFLENETKTNVKSTLDEIEDLRNHVIIAGFGRVGQLVARILGDRMIPFVAIDNDMNNVSQGRAKGLPVFFGDARRKDVMRTIGIDQASVVVISLNNPQTSMRSANMVRRNFPHVETCVRMRDDSFKDQLDKPGIRVIMPENLEPSLQLAAAVLEITGTSKDEVTQAIDAFRKSLLQSQARQQTELGGA